MTGPLTAPRSTASPSQPISEPTPGRTGRKLAITGMALLVAGVAGAITMWLTANARYDSAVEGFARAPVGCNTRLEFSQTGRFVIFVEHRGRLADVEGDCDAAAEYDGEPDTAPAGLRVSLARNGDGPLDERRTEELSYDTGGYAGLAWRQVDVDEAGSYDIEVSADDSSFAIAVGRDPNDGIVARKMAAMFSLLVGLLGGGVLLLISSRRTRASATHDAHRARAQAPAHWAAQPQAATWDPTQPPPPQMPVMTPPQMPMATPPVMRPPIPQQPDGGRVPPPPQTSAPAPPAPTQPPPTGPQDLTMWRRPESPKVEPEPSDSIPQADEPGRPPADR